MIHRIVINLIYFFLLLGCGSEEMPDDTPKTDDTVELEQVKILFIGNSHTFFNQGVDFHLMKYVEQSTLGIELIIKESTFGGYSLGDHLGNPATIDKLESDDWDIVVLQENSSVARDDKEIVLEDIQEFHGKIIAQNAATYLFMTWAYQDQPEMYFDIKDTYEEAARLTNAKVVAVGTAFKNFDGNTPNFLYDADGIHASLEGTFLASSMFYISIFNQDPRANPYTAGLPDTVAETIKNLAWETLRSN